MLKRTLSLTVIVCFFLTSLGPLPKAHADTLLGLPQPGTMVNLSPAYEPVLIKGLTMHKDNPFLFDFIVDAGDSKLAPNDQQLKTEADQLIKYFFACLTIPEKDLWVNLSPYEKDRTLPQALGQTALGRDLLAQDYILKQLTASLIYPEKNLGKEFWNRIYAKAQQLYGTSQIPVNTFNKVWIMADKAAVYEHGQTAFVVDGHLKVMLEEDYLSLQKHSSSVIARSEATKQSHTIASQIVRQIVLPEIEKEVNTGKNFAMLRQIYNSLILASWYKNNLKEALLTQVYADKSTVKGIQRPGVIARTQQDLSPEQIYHQYLKAYKKGVFNYIKEDAQADGQTIPRKYFSGGFFAGANFKPETIIAPTGRVSRAMSGLRNNVLAVFVAALFLGSTLPSALAAPNNSNVPVVAARASSDAAMKVSAVSKLKSAAGVAGKYAEADDIDLKVLGAISSSYSPDNGLFRHGLTGTLSFMAPSPIALQDIDNPLDIIKNKKARFIYEINVRKKALSPVSKKDVRAIKNLSLLLLKGLPNEYYLILGRNKPILMRVGTAMTGKQMWILDLEEQVSKILRSHDLSDMRPSFSIPSMQSHFDEINQLAEKLRGLAKSSDGQRVTGILRARAQLLNLINPELQRRDQEAKQALAEIDGQKDPIVTREAVLRLRTKLMGRKIHAAYALGALNLREESEEQHKYGFFNASASDIPGEIGISYQEGMGGPVWSLRMENHGFLRFMADLLKKEPDVAKEFLSKFDAAMTGAKLFSNIQETVDSIELELRQGPQKRHTFDAKTRLMGQSNRLVSVHGVDKEKIYALQRTIKELIRQIDSREINPSSVKREAAAMLDTNQMNALRKLGKIRELVKAGRFALEQSKATGNIILAKGSLSDNEWFNLDLISNRLIAKISLQAEDFQALLNQKDVYILDNQGEPITTPARANEIINGPGDVYGQNLEFAGNDGFAGHIIIIGPLADKAALAIPKPQVEGGIDLTSVNSGITITKDVNGGVKVNFDPAMIVRIRQQGIQSAIPVIIDVHIMPLADIRPLLGFSNNQPQQELAKI